MRQTLSLLLTFKVRALVTSTNLTALLATLAFPALAADPDPCRLLTPAEIAAKLGSTPSGGTLEGPSIDEDVGGKAWSCNRQVGESLLSVNVVEFASQAAAARGMVMMMKEAKEIPDGIPLAEAPGLGNRSVWGASAEGAMWVVQAGRYMLNVTVAGELTAPSNLREPMRQLAIAALGRLAP